jgi:hypothetical protein
MSDLCQKQAFRAAKGTPLFDHLVGAGEQCRRHFEAKHLGSFQINDQFKARWLLDWQVDGIVAAENTAGVNADLVIDVRNADTVAYQAASTANSRKW